MYPGPVAEVSLRWADQTSLHSLFLVEGLTQSLLKQKSKPTQLPFSVKLKGPSVPSSDWVLKAKLHRRPSDLEEAGRSKGGRAEVLPHCC